MYSHNKPKEVDQKIHGGIEVSSEGVKAAVIRISDAEQGSGLEVVFTELTAIALIQTSNGSFKPEVVKTVGQVITEFYTRMQQQFNVPEEQIYIFSSSDLKAESLRDLVDEVRNTTGKTITFLNLESDVQLSTVGTIPRRYREGTTWYDNRSLSVLIDIGSDTTTGGYQQLRQPIVGNPYYDYVALRMPRGVVNFANDVKKMKELRKNKITLKEFAVAARKFSEETIRAELRNERERKPGLVNRKKVYLSGEIVGALVTLLYPQDRRSFVPITIDDLNIFSRRAVSDPEILLSPDLSNISDTELLKQIQSDIKYVRKTFKPTGLIAGAEILRTLAAEFNFQGEDKKIFFARHGNLSLILSYLRMQAENVP
ncbi:MAG: hypothetical protein L0220_32665 [Acidobacteria bacterium]|nr:hypothetical protein [Acidobacteriota bacterium]